MPPRQTIDRSRSLKGACGARVARGARGDHEEGDGENHQESVMGGGTPPTVFGGGKFMQRFFTAIEQVVRNTVQTMQVSKNSTTQ